MARRMGCLLAGVIALIVLIGLAVVMFAKSGIFNVAATYPDKAPVAWMLSTTMDNSVKRHARGIKVPPLDDPAMIQAGTGHYQTMCVMCHGAPGVKIGKVGLGLNPESPKLVESAGDWKPNELFWIIKNGVRMTGMPAWGVTHSDKDIWNIVAFTQKLPKMTPAQYRQLTRKAPPMKMP